jgi:putative flippase GtrA
LKSIIDKNSFLKYGIVGIFVTIFKLIILYSLRDILDFDSYFSITTSYIFAVGLHFILNKHFTFKVKTYKIYDKITYKYVFAQFIAYFFYTINIYLLFEIVKIEFYISTIISLLISYLFNYLLYKHFVFNK